jgi:NAD(P)-dependent dehydrogenase (short-subunit alcohol dehydrogenase family)
MRLLNKTAIVTGAASGIGKGVAIAFNNEGANVVYADINDIEGFEPSDKAYFFKCDISRKEEVEELVREAASRFGTLDIIVNNAGICTQGGILETDDDTWQRTIGVNLSGTFYCMRAAARYMKENNVKGSIINISSILGKIGMPGTLSYCASKGGVTLMTRAAGLDLAPFGIRVNAIAPGCIETKMTQVVRENPEIMNMVIGNTPLGFFGQPLDIAYGAVYLASEESRFVTGEVLYIDGGWTAK